MTHFIYIELDNSKKIIVVLLDLAKTFNTINCLNQCNFIIIIT